MGAETLSSRAVVGMFFEEMEAASGVNWVSRVSPPTPFSSNQESETYVWLGLVPAMREWIGGRQPKGFRENGITIENLHFEATIEFLKKELRRDKTGQVRMRIGELVERSMSHWASLLTTLIINGTTGLGYDGVAFFSNSHAESGSNQDNLFVAGDISELTVGTPANPTATELASAFLKVIEKFYGFTDEHGEPRNEGANQFLAMVPINMLGHARVAVNSNLLAVSGGGTADNPLLRSDFGLDVVGNPRLTATDEFYVFRADARTKPLITQQETGTEPFLKALAEGSDYEFQNDAHLYSIDTWRNVGYGMWWQAAKATLSS